MTASSSVHSATIHFLPEARHELDHYRILVLLPQFSLRILSPSGRICNPLLSIMLLHGKGNHL